MRKDLNKLLAKCFSDAILGAARLQKYLMMVI